MNSHAEEQCLNDPGAFRVMSGHQALEGWVPGDDPSASLKLSETPLKESEIPTWLRPAPQREDEDRLAFRLLICAPREAYSEMILPLTPQSYQDIAKTWGFPSLVLCSIRQPYSFSSYFNPAYGKCEYLTLIPDHADGGFGLVVRFDSHWECECVVVVVHNPNTRQTNVMVAGLMAHKIPKFTATVRAAAHLLVNPLLIPVLIMSELCQNQTDWLALVHPDLEDIQRRLGMANWKYADDSPFYGPNAAENLLRLDLPGIITMLNRMSDSIRFQDQIALTLIEMLEQLEKKLQGGLTQSEFEDMRSIVDEEIGQTITLLLGSLKGCQRRIGYRNSTIHGLIDTVYTLTAQRDNYLSLDVAFHTRRDSTDMRTIAAVTMFFLPGMFIATLFSTSFFDFQAPTISSMLSPYHWIYWATTGVSTAVVLAVWFLYSTKRKSHDLPDLMGVSEPPNHVALRSYNTTDIPDDKERVKRFAGW